MAPPSTNDLIHHYQDVTAFVARLSTNDTFTDAIQAQFRAVLESLESWWALAGFNDGAAIQFSDTQREQVEELLQEIEDGLAMIADYRDNEGTVAELVEYVLEAAEKLPLPDVV